MYCVGEGSHFFVSSYKDSKALNNAFTKNRIFAAQKPPVMNTVRKYPVGIQTFERLRKEDYLDIDKKLL